MRVTDSLVNLLAHVSLGLLKGILDVNRNLRDDILNASMNVFSNASPELFSVSLVSGLHVFQDISFVLGPAFEGLCVDVAVDELIINILKFICDLFANGLLILIIIIIIIVVVVVFLENDGSRSTFVFSHCLVDLILCLSGCLFDLLLQISLGLVKGVRHV